MLKGSVRSSSRKVFSFKLFFLLLSVFALISLSPISVLAQKKNNKKGKNNLDESAEVLSTKYGQCIRNPNGGIIAAKRIKGRKIIRAKTNKRIARNAAKKVRSLTKRLNKQLPEAQRVKAERQLEKFQIRMVKFSAKRFRQACAEAFASLDQNPNPGAPGDQDAAPPVSLVRYTGPFTKVEAAKLYRRYGFGATWAELVQAEAEGLEATVERLLTWNQSCENAMASDYADIICEGDQAFWDSEPENEGEECILADPNDFSIEGLKRATYFKMQYTCNPAHYKFLTVVHSKNASGQINALNADTAKKWFARQHFEGLLLDFAKSWDYGQFITDQAIGDPNGLGVGDPLVNFFNLDSGASFAVVGQDGITRTAANENYGRELLELTTVGVEDYYTDPNNPTPTYGLLDVISASNALAGGGYINREFEVGTDDEGEPIVADVDYPAIITLNEIKGPKQMWVGTRYETTISNRQDLVNTIKAHPMTAQRFAQILVEEYVSDNAPRPTIAVLGSIIRQNNLNVRAAMKELMMAEFNFDGSSPRFQTTFDFVFSFLRSTQLPMRQFLISDLMEKCGQEIGASQNRSAGQIFGWDIRALNSESYTIECRNELYDLLEYYDDMQNKLRSEEMFGPDYSITDVLLADKPFFYRGDVWIVEKLATLFGERLSDAQLNFLIEDIMNSRPELCNTSFEINNVPCEEGTYYKLPEPWSEDPASNTTHIWKIADLIAVFVDRTRYRVIR